MLLPRVTSDTYEAKTYIQSFGAILSKEYATRSLSSALTRSLRSQSLQGVKIQTTSRQTNKPSSRSSWTSSNFTPPRAPPHSHPFHFAHIHYRSEVRRAALIHTPLTAATVPALLTRTRDTDPITRKLLYASVLRSLRIPGS
jgi:hypothetical protein